jgi:hypothetical protein
MLISCGEKGGSPPDNGERARLYRRSMIVPVATAPPQHIDTNP